jgi:sulfate transport system permease protein
MADLARSPRRALVRRGDMLSVGIVSAILGFVVVLPLAAVLWSATRDGTDSFVRTLSNPQAVAALKFTFLVSALVALVNAVTGTLVAWVLVRDRFRGTRLLEAVIDLPFALPTIVAGLTLLALYGPSSPVGMNLAFTKVSVFAALLFVTFPFVVRSVQPVLMELDEEVEQAAQSLGASRATTFRRIIFPALVPAIATGTGLSFAKAIGEFGSIVLISGNVPFDTEVASVYIFGLIESYDPEGAAAISIVLLGTSVVVLAMLDVVRRRYLR